MTVSRDTTYATGSEPSAEREAWTATGRQWVIGHGRQQAIITEVGATLRSYAVGTQPVIHGFAADERSQGGRGQVLAPWPNRIDGGAYTFGAVAAQAPINEVDRQTAIHGLVRWQPWAMVATAQNRVRLHCVLHPSPAYPFHLDMEIEYHLGRRGLTVTTDVKNVGPTDLPFGLGFHPYLVVGTLRIDTARLRVPARRFVVADARGLPVSTESVLGTPFDFTEQRPVGATQLDTAFGTLERGADGRARVDLDHSDTGGGVTVWADECFPWFMVFSGDSLPVQDRRVAMAIEPMTCPPNAFRSGEDLIVLTSGSSWSGSWGIEPRQSGPGMA